MNEVSSDASSKRFEITGLAPETSYNFRGAYLSTRSADAAGDNGGGRTGAEQRIRGVERVGSIEFYNAVISSNDVYQTNYGPYASSDSKWWDCNNSETTPEDRTISNYTYKSFPMVTYVPGNGKQQGCTDNDHCNKQYCNKRHMPDAKGYSCRETLCGRLRHGPEQPQLCFPPVGIKF